MLLVDGEYILGGDRVRGKGCRHDNDVRLCRLANAKRGRIAL